MEFYLLGYCSNPDSYRGHDRLADGKAQQARFPVLGQVRIRGGRRTKMLN